MPDPQGNAVGGPSPARGASALGRRIGPSFHRKWCPWGPPGGVDRYGNRPQRRAISFSHPATAVIASRSGVILRTGQVRSTDPMRRLAVGIREHSYQL